MEESWARTEMAGVEVWDQRCRGSLERICEQVLARPEESFSAACGPGLRQAGSRIFGAPQRSVEKLLAGHVEQTAQRCQAQAAVSVAQDTTDVNYTTHKGASGLGPINSHPDSRGLVLHTALALTTEGVPLGLLSQESWAREPAMFGTAAHRRTRPVAEKESQQWLTGLPRVVEALPEGPGVVLVQDREADVFAFLAAPRPAHVELIVRVCQPRRVEVDAGAASSPRTVLEAARQAPVLGQLRVQVPRKPGQPEREAVLELAASAGVVKAPRRRSVEVAAGSLALWVVRATEIAPPPGCQPIEWILLTTLAVDSLAAARRCVQYYALRWRVERFHYTLKQGCTVERLQFEEAHTLKNALALYSIVAWRLLWLTYTAREQPQAPATELLPPLELRVLAEATQAPVSTAREAIRALAQLGGFPLNPSAKEPGVKVLWRGLRRLEAMVEGWLLALQAGLFMRQD
jgi:DDE family transposase